MTIPIELQEEKLLEYDPKKYNFEQVIHDILLGDEPTNHELCDLHTLKEAQDSHVLTFASDQNLLFHRRYYDSPDLPKMLELYRKFVKEYIAPMYPPNAPLVVQTKPTFRVHLPNNTAIPSDVGGDPEKPGLHRDADYNHPTCEVNYWVPVTTVTEGNGLQLETKPQKGDYRPVPMEVGQVLRFWGAECMHFNTMNSGKGAKTRVSFDFRVMTYSDWKKLPDEFFETAKTVQAKMPMAIGGYYMLYKDGEFHMHDEEESN